MKRTASSKQWLSHSLGINKWSNIIKDTFIKCETFEEAVDYISATPGMNPCYLTICGIDAGAKLTLDRFKNRTEWVYLNDLPENDFEDLEANKKTKEFDVQTNFDTFEEPPERDNNRFVEACKMMNLIKPDLINEKRMIYSVLNVYPICNDETVYCCYMNPKTYRCTVMFPDSVK